MADLKEAFPISVDFTTGAGIAPISRVEGDGSSAKAGLIAFGYKDAAGNVVLPQLDGAGSVPVAFMPEADKFKYGTNVGSLTSVDIATLDETVISTGKIYHDFCISVSSFRESVFTLVHIDDASGTPSETPMGVWRLGPGQYSFVAELHGMFKNTTAGTGDQKFVLRGLNLDKASTMNASLSCKEAV